MASIGVTWRSRDYVTKASAGSKHALDEPLMKTAFRLTLLEVTRSASGPITVAACARSTDYLMAGLDNQSAAEPCRRDGGNFTNLVIEAHQQTPRPYNGN